MTELRWVGFCHSCERYDASVQTRYDRAAKTLCDACYSSGRSRTRLSPWEAHRAARPGRAHSSLGRAELQPQGDA